MAGQLEQCAAMDNSLHAALHLEVERVIQTEHCLVAEPSHKQLTPCK